MTKLILLRHGESLGNMVNRFLGHTDMDLSPTGYRQASLAGEYLKKFKIDVIYSSDLIRAYNTAKPTADALGIEIIKSSNLREIYAGNWEGKTFDELDTEFEDAYYVWKNDIGNAHCTGGESVFDLSKRICPEVEKIAKENDGKTVLIATHATPLRCMMAKWNNQPIESMKDIPWVKNASLTFAEYEDGVFKITQKDFTEHLGETVTKLPKNV